MYTFYPSQTDVTLTANSVPQQNGMPIGGNEIPGIKLDAIMNFEDQKTPTKVAILLQKFGWSECGSHPDTKQQMWQKNPPDDASDEAKAGWDNDLKNGFWLWDEAMAYEFGKFIGIGDDVDWSKSQGSANMGSAGATSSPGRLGG